MTCSVKVAIVYDHILIRNGIVKVLDELGYEVIFQANNEKDLFVQLSVELPEILFVVVNIHSSDNFEMMHNVTFQYPQLKIIALSMQDDDNAIVRMLARGVKGYILKDAEMDEVRQVIANIEKKGYNYQEPDFGRLVKHIQRYNRQHNRVKEVLLSDQEIEFLKYLSTELTYKEIAAKMYVSHRTIEGFRNNLCEKLKIKTRIGLVLYAIQKAIVNVS
jgi:two-component system invasion response regulator UvrY